MRTADGLTRRCRSYIEDIRSMHQSEAPPEPPTVYDETAALLKELASKGFQ